MNDKKIALVTGANRGLGLESCKELAKLGIHVILSSRDANKGKKQVEELAKQGIVVDYVQLNTDDEESIQQAIEEIKKKYGRIDILINNAAILLDATEKTDKKILSKTFETNVIGPYLLIEAVLPMMCEHKYGRIVNVSSQAGQLAHMGTEYPAYRISKVALNAVTAIFAARVRGEDILINSVCPGWVKTDMGGPNAPRDVEEGVETIVWAATLPHHGATGCFFYDKNKIMW